MKSLNVEYINPTDDVKNTGLSMSISARTPLIDPNIYRPYLLNKFYQLGGRLERKKIKSLDVLASSYHIVVNCAGWESKFLTYDDKTFPIRGQIEVANINENIKHSPSLNLASINSYIVFRPQSDDCVIGTTYQINDTEKEAREVDRDHIISKTSPLLSEAKSIKTVSKVGIRCGRLDVRIKSEVVKNLDKIGHIIHCYGHGGCGFSSSWGSAYSVLRFCRSFV